MVRPGPRLAKRPKGRIPARGPYSMLWSNPTAGARCSGPVCAENVVRLIW
jgi:hypothetical protein